MDRTTDLKKYIREIPDFPKPGILFYDITTLLANGPAWRTAVERMAKLVEPMKPQTLAGIESRGFLVAAALAVELGTGCVLIRKKGKLPGKKMSYTYDLEYGTDTIEVHDDAISPGQSVVVVDDLLATGGTLSAAVALLRRLGADVRGAATLIELTFLNGRSKLDVPFGALLGYDS